VTEQDTYTDFMNTAEMAGREFDAEKWNIKLLNAQTRQVYIDTGAEGEQVGEATEEQKQMQIPRRPAWAGLTPEQLKEGEQAAFLEWRRELAELQETTTCIVTPYEKNLEFWRQLWRVIERSDLVIQIVDSRHPLLFRCPDVELYVKEVSGLKQNLLLVNKADFLTLEQRQAWAEHFEQQGINFAFFSAITEDESVLEAEEDKEVEEDTSTETEESSDEDEEEVEDEEVVEEVEIQSAPTAHIGESGDLEEESSIAEKDGEPLKTDILNCAQMVQLFRSYKRHECENVTVGFIGYPNVGKSSTINKLLSAKKVRVSETPGKTKHFQTLVLEEDVTLCDCPGLVMPSVCNSKAGMVLQGILPIDQLRDHVPVINLLLDFIPDHVLESRQATCFHSLI
jgi:large subunit GTPase 1